MRSRTNNLLILLVLFLFSSLGVARHLHMFGEDLASSYVGCRLLANGEGSHLYSHSTTIFSVVGDSAWYDMAQRTGFAPLGLLHPYVQTPLWAWSLQPVCTRMNFRAFCDGFIVFFMLCTSAMLWLVARYWTPTLFHPGWMAVIFGAFYVAEPFKYSIFLAQTHVIFLLLSVGALMLAERDEEVWAGVALALAALVKITPGYLCVYWLVTRRWKAAASFAIAFLVFTGLGVVAVGPELTRDYFHSLSENSNTLLLAFNNQSLAAWWMGQRLPSTEVTEWWIHRLPAVLKLLSPLLSIVCAALGGWVDRGIEHDDGQASTAPFGAVFALLAATAFAPIAWSHYYILLVIPAMFITEVYRVDRRLAWVAVLALIFLLNLYPISFGAVHLHFGRYSVVRSQFYSGLIAMAAMAVAGLMHIGRSGRSGAGSVLRGRAA